MDTVGSDGIGCPRETLSLTVPGAACVAVDVLSENVPLQKYIQFKSQVSAGRNVRVSS